MPAFLSRLAALATVASMTVPAAERCAMICAMGCAQPPFGE